MILFWHPSGPKMRWANGFLEISDLNPESAMHWRLSRKELFLLGVRAIAAAIGRR